MTRKTEWRLPDTAYKAPMRCLASAEGYAMVRYYGCCPHVIDLAKWLSYPLCDNRGNLIGGEGRADG